MHILELPSFFPPYGGSFCLDQSKALAGIGHEVRILSNVQLGITIGLKDYLTLPYHRYEHQLEGIPVFQSYQRGLPRFIRFNVDRWIAIVRSMFSTYIATYGRPDILHAHCAKWAGYAAMLISREYGIPYVITEHLPLMLLQQEFGPAPSSAWQIPLLKQAYEQAAIVLPVSEELVDDMACYYGKNYRWQYLSNTIDTDFFHYQPRPELTNRRFRFCCLADYYHRKGYDILFEAFRRLQQTSDAELHIAGRFTDGAACRREISRLGLREVHVHGRLDKEGVRDLLYQCDALVLASRSEVQPLVLLEAMSTGIPVIATECIPTSLRLPKACTIVPIANAPALTTAMHHLIDHPLLQGAHLSHQIATLSSPQVIAHQLEKIFQTLH